MGNNQSDGLQFCSVRSDPLASRFMVDKDFRIDYVNPKARNIEACPPKQQRQEFYWKHEDSPPQYAVKKHEDAPPTYAHQQRVRDAGRQQQKQEESVDIPLKGETPKTMEVQVEPEVKEKGGKATVFEGIFGDITLQTDGFVEFIDSIGNDFDEVYNPEKIQKTYPMGISFGGLSKSIWFKDVEDRNTCFEMMIGNLPPSYAACSANPEYYEVPIQSKNVPSYAAFSANPEYYEVPVKPIQSKNEDDSDNVKVFNGIQGNDVVVHKDNQVEYCDLDGVKHCVIYDRHKIQKCFPHGICFGGLNRTIWLTDEMERDLCYMLMQVTGEVKAKEELKTYSGLYGSVVLKADYEVNFTSLVGNRVTAAWYDPNRIYRVFPLGISGGGFPSTIWFKEMEDMENCFEAMKQKCLQ